MTKRAFSMMELLTAICVIAAVVGLMTPFVDKFTKKDRTVLALREIFETISPAVERYSKMDEPAQYWAWNTDSIYESSNAILEKYILPIFEESKRCNNVLLCVGGFMSMDNEEYVNYRQESDYARALVGKNDIHIALRSTGSCVPNVKDNLCGILVVDVDNKDGENKMGYDVFLFGFYGDGSFRPFGSDFPPEKIEGDCSKFTSGETCAAKIQRDNWVIKETGEGQYPVH